MRVHLGDNLTTLRRLKREGTLFDVIELDGPYMAGLEEGWDDLTLEQYIDHYAERLPLVRDLLHPWGVVFVFGWPEGCAEIASWARRSGTLHLRRWLHWYNQKARHQARYIQTVLMLVQMPAESLFEEFKAWLTKTRKAIGMTIRDSQLATGINPNALGGGYLWYEAPSSDLPSRGDYEAIKRIFDTPARFDILPFLTSWKGLTDIDTLRVPIEEAESLNDNGLRSKPVRLYLDLFGPARPRIEKTPRLLVLYGGSGNAAVAAGVLGYETDICELDAGRAALIQRRYAREVARWVRATSQLSLPLDGILEGIQAPPLFRTNGKS